MSSCLRLITSNVVTRSFRPTLVSSSRLFSIYTDHQSYTTMPTNDFYDQARPRILWPKISSMSFDMWMFGANQGRYLLLRIPGSDDKGMYVELNIKEGETHKECDVKQEMKDGMLKVISLPNEDEFKANIMANILASDIIASFREITAERSWAYYDMFSDRSILGKRFCPIIAMMSPINSFSIYNKEHGEGLKSQNIKMNMPGLEKTKLTTQGLCVSLKMPELKREDVKTYFDYDTFFIEGKTKEEHYITGIHLPKGIHKKHNMIKREMKDGVLYAIIPSCVEKEDQDQLNLFLNGRKKNE